MKAEGWPTVAAEEGDWDWEAGGAVEIGVEGFRIKVVPGGAVADADTGDTKENSRFENALNYSGNNCD